MPYLQTCRFCKDCVSDGSFLRYAMRANACPRCFLEHKGVDGLRELFLWQLEGFPALVAHDAGLLEALTQVIKEKRAAEELRKQRERERRQAQQQAPH